MTRKKKQQAEAEAPPTAAPGFSDAPAPATQVSRISPIDIQQKVFRSSVRGYHEREVDQFLDEVTEELARLLAETRSLREQLERAEMRPTARFGADAEGAAELEDARVQAARTLADAREEAARVVAEARSEAVVILDAAAAGAERPGAAGAAGAAAAGAAATATGRAPDRDFIHREREFLQAMASLIQDHAEAIRDDLRRVRGEPPLDEDAEEEPSAGPAPPSSERAEVAPASESAHPQSGEALAAGVVVAAAEAAGSDPDESASPTVDADAGDGASDDEDRQSISAELSAVASGSDAETGSHDDVIDLAGAGSQEAGSPTQPEDVGPDPTPPASEEIGDQDEPGWDADEDAGAQPPVFGTQTETAVASGDADEAGDADRDAGASGDSDPAWLEHPEPRAQGGDRPAQDMADRPWEVEDAEPPPSLEGGAPHGETGYGGQGGSSTRAEAPDDAGQDAAQHPATVGAARAHSDADRAEGGTGSSTTSGGPPPGWAARSSAPQSIDPAAEDDEDEAGRRSLRELFWGED